MLDNPTEGIVLDQLKLKIAELIRETVYRPVLEDAKYLAGRLLSKPLCSFESVKY